MSMYWCYSSYIRLSLEQVCVKDLLTVGSKKPSASSLHGGVLKLGRVVRAKELKFFHAHVDTSTNGWGALISTNKGNEKRATINDDQGGPNASIDLEIDVDKRGENVEVVTPAEVVQLKKLVRDWVAERKDDVAVIDEDDDADLAGGRDADGGGGDGGGNVGGGGAGVGDGDGSAGIGGSGDGGANVGEGGDGGNDPPSCTDAAVDNLLGVFRARHPLSPATSEEMPIVRRKRRSKCVVSRVDSDLDGAWASSETTSDLDFNASACASPESL